MTKEVCTYCHASLITEGYIVCERCLPENVVGAWERNIKHIMTGDSYYEYPVSFRSPQNKVFKRYVPVNA